jgi:hypothetical protein
VSTPPGEITSVTVKLADVEPIAGLLAACGRFCAHLDEKAINAMEPGAVESLSVMQSIMWRLEHSQPEI